MKQKMIEEKLEKLGVEKGSGSSVPHIHAPHARAASVSTLSDIRVFFVHQCRYRFRLRQTLHCCSSS